MACPCSLCHKSRRLIGMRELRTGRMAVFRDCRSSPDRSLRETNRLSCRAKTREQVGSRCSVGGGLAIAFSAYLRSFTFRLLLFNPRFPCGYYRADEWRFCIASKALFLMPYMEPRTIKNFSKFVCHGAVPFVSRVRNKRYRNSASLNLFQDRAEGYGLWHKHRQLKRFAPLHWKNIS